MKYPSLWPQLVCAPISATGLESSIASELSGPISATGREPNIAFELLGPVAYCGAGTFGFQSVPVLLYAFIFLDLIRHTITLARAASNATARGTPIPTPTATSWQVLQLGAEVLAVRFNPGEVLVSGEVIVVDRLTVEVELEVCHVKTDLKSPWMATLGATMPPFPSQQSLFDPKTTSYKSEVNQDRHSVTNHNNTDMSHSHCKEESP